MLNSISSVITCKISNNFLSNDIINDFKAGSNDQESIQSSITSDEKVTKHTRKYHLQESRGVNLYPAGDHRAKDSIAKANVKQITQKHCPGTVSKITSIFSEPINIFFKDISWVISTFILFCITKCLYISNKISSQTDHFINGI